jgi:hypothetical protein
LPKFHVIRPLRTQNRAKTGNKMEGSVMTQRIHALICALALMRAGYRPEGDEVERTRQAVPHRRADPLRRDVEPGVFPTASSEGLILINTGMPGPGEMIEAWIRQLGIDRMALKLIITSHSHIDHTPGHANSVVFPDGCGVDPGYRVHVGPSYPGIEHEYRDTLHVLESLKPDIWPCTTRPIASPTSARSATKGIAPWVDPEGYRRWIAEQRAKSKAELAAAN